MAGLMGTKQAAPPPPEPEPTPMVDEMAIRRAKERALLKNRNRGGRASTILSGYNDDKLGG